jgi:proline racemase
VGSEFIGIALSAVEEDGYQGIAPQVSGMAYKTGDSTFTTDPYDPLVPGFVLR